MFVTTLDTVAVTSNVRNLFSSTANSISSANDLTTLFPRWVVSTPLATRCRRGSSRDSVLLQNIFRGQMFAVIVGVWAFGMRLHSLLSGGRLILALCMQFPGKCSAQPGPLSPS